MRPSSIGVAKTKHSANYKYENEYYWCLECTLMSKVNIDVKRWCINRAFQSQGAYFGESERNELAFRIFLSQICSRVGKKQKIDTKLCFFRMSFGVTISGGIHRRHAEIAQSDPITGSICLLFFICDAAYCERLWRSLVTAYPKRRNAHSQYWATIPRHVIPPCSFIVIPLPLIWSPWPRPISLGGLWPRVTGFRIGAINEAQCRSRCTTAMHLHCLRAIRHLSLIYLCICMYLHSRRIHMW